MHRVIQWTAIAAALVPVPFVIQDAVSLQLWRGAWYWQAFAVFYMLALSVLAYGIVRGIGWLIAKATGRKAA